MDARSRSAGRSLRGCLILTTAIALGWLNGCSDGPTATVCESSCELPQGLIVSNPISATGVAAGIAPARVNGAPAASAGSSVAFVSLAPGKAPTGSRAILRRVGDATSLMAVVIDGGFDPVPVAAQASDSIEVVVIDAGGSTVYSGRVAVVAARAPVIVRTNPPPKKRDVPLNAAIVIVFSEPVDGRTLNSSAVQLLRGTTPVAGTVSLLQGGGTAAAFIADAPLAPNAGYSLEVTAGVKDLQGEALATGAKVPFTTGQSSVGPAASIALSPDTGIVIGATPYQLTATVRDAAGNELIDQPIAWSIRDTAGPAGGLAVSQTGLLTADAEGGYLVTAEVNGLLAIAWVAVNFGSPPASVAIVPSPAAVSQYDTILLTSVVRDAAGHLLNREVGWASAAPAVATVAPYLYPGTQARVIGVSQGTVTISATSGTGGGVVSVTVTPPLPVASVALTPKTASLVLQGQTPLSAALRDASGRLIAGRPIAWTSDNGSVATVDANGLVTGVGPGAALISATSEGASDTAVITVTSLTLLTVSVGGTSSQCSHSGCSAALAHTCALTDGGAAFCWGDYSAVPAAIAGGLSYVSLVVGAVHACGLTAGGAAYCWGSNSSGQLGDGSTSSPGYLAVPVSGGLTFAAISAGRFHTCGLAAGGSVSCWGANFAGQLGDGSTTSSSIPVAVTGGLTFVALSASGGHTCGLTTSGQAYCWGYNAFGQLGDGSTNPSSVPVAVSGGLSFSALSAFGAHTCGLAMGGAAYCWGHNTDGELGDGTFTSSTVPVAVTGGLTFSGLALGAAPYPAPFQGTHSHTCGVTRSGVAYCWGSNAFGQLGSESATVSAVPVAVAGGLTFSSLSASGVHTCGLATNGAVYCWGDNYRGELGTGTTTNSSVPVKVLGQP